MPHGVGNDHGHGEGHAYAYGRHRHPHGHRASDQGNEDDQGGRTTATTTVIHVATSATTVVSTAHAASTASGTAIARDTGVAPGTLTPPVQPTSQPWDAPAANAANAGPVAPTLSSEAPRTTGSTAALSPSTLSFLTPAQVQQVQGLPNPGAFDTVFRNLAGNGAGQEDLIAALSLGKLAQPGVLQGLATQPATQVAASLRTLATTP